MNNRQKLISNVNTVIKSFASRFNNNPFSYFYEEDVRAILLTELINSNSEIILLPKNDWTKSFTIPLLTSPFKSEFPNSKKDESSDDPSKFDIVFIEQDLNENVFYFWPCSIIIELKLRYGHLNTSLLCNDYNKIFRYKKRTNDIIGISILFEQNPESNTEKALKYYQKKNINFRTINLLEMDLLDNHNHAIHIFPNVNNDCIILSEAF